ncbi:helix-turn-helix domain-containing protein [Phytoactinopolyspora limicola]|uniref:helix-turn-helix domain-containing protein n=1 Tax=Phytoactinopolyspora limicola TaxID=2715536 RepID=UPI00140D6710
MNTVGVDAYALAEFLGVPVATIRSWANRGKIHPVGKDRRGRTLYDPAEVTRHARHARTFAQAADQVQH